MNDRTTMVAVFEDQAAAESAASELRSAGFADDQIGVVAPRLIDEQGEVVKAEPTGGALSGAASGGVLGGLLAAGAATLIPGIGPVIGGGILATVLGGAAMGAAAGGLLGTLGDLGVSEEEARAYESDLRAGRTIVAVQARGRSAEASAILDRHGAGATPLESDAARARAYAANPLSAALRETAETAGSLAATPVRDMRVEQAGTVQAVERRAGNLEEGGAHEMTTGQLHGHSTLGDDGPTSTAAGGRGPDQPAGVSGAQPAEDVEPAYDAPETDWRPGSDAASGESAAPARRSVESPVESAPAERGGMDEQAEATAETPAGVVGRWPTRADDPHTQEAAPVEPITNVNRPGYRAPDAAAGSGPYVNPDEDLERVGATSAMTARPDAIQWDTAAADFRQTLSARQSQAPRAGWDDLEAGYRYGFEMAGDSRFSGSEWDEVERDLSSGYPDWARRQGYTASDGHAWNALRPHARDAWDYARRHR